MIERLSVPFEYPVVFTKDSLQRANRAIISALTTSDPTRRHRALAVLDSGFADAWPNASRDLSQYFSEHAAELELVCAPVIVPGGEAAKGDPKLIDELHATFHEHKLDRHSFVLIFGGGAVLDAVGYAAATAHRGLRTVRLPTTVLSQADSGVGVKNGVNAFGAKNFLGTFAPPFAVVADSAFLTTLPAREATAGLAEAVKVALIRDAAFFDWLESNQERLVAREADAVGELVRRSAKLHLTHIRTSGDPFEQGSARPLDFGHWAAHKLESLTGHEVRHGEAVAMGMLLDSRYSFEKGLLDARAFERIERLLQALGLPLWHPQLMIPGKTRPLLLDGLEEFRQHLGGELTITLIADVGKAIEVHAMDERLILRALAWMEARALG